MTPAPLPVDRPGATLERLSVGLLLLLVFKLATVYFVAFFGHRLVHQKLIGAIHEWTGGGSEANELLRSRLSV